MFSEEATATQQEETHSTEGVSSILNGLGPGTITTHQAGQAAPVPEAEGAFDTGDLPAPKRDPEAHRGLIIGVTANTYDSGATAIVFSLKSLNTDLETDYALWVPKEFVADINIPKDKLSTGTLDPSTGRVKGNQQEQYAIRIANSDRTAELQRIRQIAYNAGKQLPRGAPKPKDFSEFVALHNALLTNVGVVFTRSVDRDPEDLAFANILKVRGIYDPAEIIGNTKRLKGYTKLWEQQ